MTKTENSQLTDFEWQAPKTLLSFIKGPDAKAFYDLIIKKRKELGNPPCLEFGYCRQTGPIIETNFFISVLADIVAREQGMRVAMPQDENSGPLVEMIYNKHYTTFPCLDIRSHKHTYKLNKDLLKRIIELTEEREGKAKFPFRISGFSLQRTDNGYGLIPIPRDNKLANLAIIHDERLSGKHHGEHFTRLDNQGIPVFSKEGLRTWYAKQGGIARVNINRYLDGYSYYDILDYSLPNGEIVLVSTQNKEFNKKQDTKQIEETTYFRKK